ncbi:MAG: hypothetical protein GX058_07025 [Firmicutes bacterium]|nr:hypothetical protein [Bacillota bacterium]
MLWTIIPEEIVFEGIDEEYIVTKEIVYQGVLMKVRPCPEADGVVIERLISSDPQVFLRQDLQPGTIIRHAI